MMFRKYKVMIDDKNFVIKRGETKELNIPEGEHTMTVKMDWAKSQYSFSMENVNKKELIIKHRIPNIFIYIFCAIFFTLLVLTLFSIRFPLFGFICICIFWIPFLYISTVKINNYFIIKEH